MLRSSVVAACWLWVLMAASGAWARPEEQAAETEQLSGQASDRPGAGLPGASPFFPELVARLEGALAAKGPDYEPRTEHLREDGRPLYTNRLILESSPYLLQHAHNPVDWYPWGDEAFERARDLGRPVFLSIGYSTCHWCHVMERESFEDEEIARFLNQHYVAIKVDREERPDIDSVYMTAVQILTGRGGWPMSVWLTPDRRPFYGGSYFPPRDGDRGARFGFLTLLTRLEEAWRGGRDGLVDRAARLSAMVERSLEGGDGTSEGLPAPGLIGAAAAAYRESFDAENGGLARAPKFPADLSIRLLLRAHRRTGEGAYLEMAELTLEKMAAGGLFDQVGGGFHRYSTDAEWLVPHFEKMLYDNARLVVAYLEGFQATGRRDFADTARRTLDYLQAEMTSADGAFYSATDADSPGPDGERQEGLFFTWTPEEIEAVLGEADARAVVRYFGVTAGGDFEGRSILHRSLSVEATAEALGWTTGDLDKVLSRSLPRLYEARSRRPPPLRDDKILASWNGLVISAFSIGGQVLGEPGRVEAAERAAAFVLERMRVDGSLRRTWRRGDLGPQGFLDDYAFMVAGLIDLYQASADPRWLREALELQAILDQRFWDSGAGGYFLSGSGAETLLAREKPIWDGAEPSGNSVALLNLLRLAELTTDDAYRRRADALLSAFAGVAGDSSYAAALAELLVGLDFRHGGPKEIVLVVPGAAAEAKPFLDRLYELFLPNKVVVTISAESDVDRLASLVPFVEGKIARNGEATAYVCQRHVCQLPTTDLEVFVRQLRE